MHMQADCMYNEQELKFAILNEAKPTAVLKMSSSWYSQEVRVFVNITRT